MPEGFNIRPSNNSSDDIDFILHCNHEIEGEDAALTKKRLQEDILTNDPKAFIHIFEVDNKPIGLIFYSTTYWASKGLILWISQMYINPHNRGKHIYKIKQWINEKTLDIGASRIVWGTSSKAIKTNDLWKALGALNINDNFQFWIKKIN